MPTTISLQGTASYGVLILYILFFILISPLILRFIKKRKAKKNKKKEAKVTPQVKKIPPTIKERYEKQLLSIIDDYKSEKIDEREGYQLLSKFLREFFKEYAGVDVTTKTLAQIRGINNSRLEELIEEFYEYEFSPDSNGDIVGAVKRTIQSVKHW